MTAVPAAIVTCSPTPCASPFPLNRHGYKDGIAEARSDHFVKVGERYFRPGGETVFTCDISGDDDNFPTRPSSPTPLPPLHPSPVQPVQVHPGSGSGRFQAVHNTAAAFYQRVLTSGFYTGRGDAVLAIERSITRREEVAHEAVLDAGKNYVINIRGLGTTCCTMMFDGVNLTGSTAVLSRHPAPNTLLWLILHHPSAPCMRQCQRSLARPSPSLGLTVGTVSR